MHPKHRNGSANGYRANTMGMSGIPSSSSARMFPEAGSMRNQRMYHNSEYRNENRFGGGGGYGCGLGHSKQFHSSRAPPQQEPDIFVEAGKLAAEYLVSKGLIPPTALSGKWHGDSFRSRKGESSDGRVSVHSRLGNAAAPDRRRYYDDHNAEGSRSSSSKGRKRSIIESSKSNGPEDNSRELGRLGSSSESPGISPDAAETGGEARLSSESTQANNAADFPEAKAPSDSEEPNNDESEGKVPSNDHVDLLNSCKFANVPTKPRSSLTSKSSKNDQQQPVNEDKMEDSEVGSSMCNDLSYKKHHSEDSEMDPDKPEQCSKSESKEQEKERDSEIGRGEKRIIDCDTDDIDGFKRFRQWMLPLDMQSDCTPRPVLEKSGTSDGTIPTSLDISLSANDHKEFSSASFKTCDLNLNEADPPPILVFSPSKQLGDLAKPVEIDLSLSNNIEVIDLEKDQTAFGNSERRGEAMFNELEGFSNASVQNDGHDGYGLMISELLGNDIPNCSSASTDLNSLHNHMVLPNAEGILGDDDSIYMSLEEIPISLLGAWEHPSQDFGKPF